MRSREEAAGFIRKQLAAGTVSVAAPLPSWPERKLEATAETKRLKGRQWHYGVQELRELLDFIYGGEPQTEAEGIRKPK